MRKIKLTAQVEFDSGVFIKTQTLLVSDLVGEALVNEGKAVETDDAGCWVDQSGASLVTVE